MKLIGLTGGIGAGKSTAADFLRQRGLPVVDTDAIAHQLVQPGQPSLGEIIRTFGEGIVDEYGRLKRRELAELVFTKPAARKRLEAILHPRIREAWLALANDWLQRGATVGVVVIPLLFETDAPGLFYTRVCVACSAGVQRERLRARGWDDAHIDSRLIAQWPMWKKMEASDFVVWTECDLPAHEAQLDRVLQAL
jgi:dephospho-CoA kinase